MILYKQLKRRVFGKCDFQKQNCNSFYYDKNTQSISYAYLKMFA